MKNAYRMKMVVLSSGERLPMLLDSDGMPLFEPTVYSLAELRARNRAANTIESTLRAIMIFYIYLDDQKINIIDRLKQGDLLLQWEIESLVDFCRKPMKEKSSRLCTESESLLHAPVTTSLEKYRKRQDSPVDKDVLPNTAANRLRIIRDFLVWLSSVRLLRHNKQSSSVESLKRAQQIFINAINARMPAGTKGFLDRREGLDPESRGKLLQMVEPGSEDNPWIEEHAKYRNSLIVNWLYHLGLRRGELLGIRISDIDFRGSTVIVARRADDPLDPRRNQPNAKTKARKIPLSPGLLDMTEKYVMSYRATFPGARKHDFLFVASNSGVPMSISSLNKIFIVLVKKCPELPKVYPHLLRHTWNDIFSEKMDERNESENAEKKTRAYLMGWSDTSGTAATYTRRHIRKKANEVSLEMQKKMTGGEYEGNLDDKQ